MSTKTADTIVQTLEQDIITGVISPGTRLDETGLSQRFSVSRTPVREALQRLEASGLVEIRPHRGAAVRRTTLREMVEMFEMMAELEAFSARLASRRQMEPALARMAAAQQGCHKAAEAGDRDTYYRENEIFHQALYDASGNSFLAAQARTLQARLRPYRRMQLHAQGRMMQSLGEHAEILAALRKGDGPKAERIVRGHILIQGEKFTDLLANMENLEPQIAHTTTGR